MSYSTLLRVVFHQTRVAFRPSPKLLTKHVVPTGCVVLDVKSIFARLGFLRGHFFMLLPEKMLSHQNTTNVTGGHVQAWLEKLSIAWAWGCWRRFMQKMDWSVVVNKPHPSPPLAKGRESSLSSIISTTTPHCQMDFNPSTFSRGRLGGG